VRNEHQNQGVKARNSPLLLSWTTHLDVQGHWKIAICGPPGYKPHRSNRAKKMSQKK